MTESPETDVSKAGKYLTFRIAEEGYGVEILKVQEIIGMMAVTRVPRTPDHVRGVINLRGKVIPVVDLRLKFGLESQDNTRRTCVIVTQVHRGNSAVTIGIIVDEVSEVMDVTDSQIEPPPSFGSQLDTEFILGMGKIGDKVLILLDIDRVLAEDEITMLKEATR